MTHIVDLLSERNEIDSAIVDIKNDVETTEIRIKEIRNASPNEMEELEEELLSFQNEHMHYAQLRDEISGDIYQWFCYLFDNVPATEYVEGVIEVHKHTGKFDLG